ncbi:family 78 glycoside hydrolase catalytic domain [Phytoactinopolyspora halotolerans]|uniref:alpha-L-rhamnosidase n=1 Tax=Phytoactinopolyspora halotolerans TaxID=1981512 RepID=A0A6L9SFX2_9ACTN|nr:family 78 glycoside hydrolase catalytic domain [Phytoactinopolyspora halotolerans]NEE03967.1 family 78 glycoside hydrolase catalytic domain [Phytoactinopolyspora halotolerans]
MLRPERLMVEHLEEACGITMAKPRLSWWLPKGCTQQVAYRIRAGRWDSGMVESDQSILVPYAGPALRSREHVEWTVKVWTDAGESAWSEYGSWEMGLLDPSDWKASWIEPFTCTQGEPETDRCWVFRGTANHSDLVRRARLYVTAHGIYEFFINGHRVGDAELTPGFTSYESRLQVQSFDVTDLLVAGENVLAAVLSGGWIGWTPRYRDMRVGLLAQLEVEGFNGSLSCYGTGSEWLYAGGPIKSANLIRGQVLDLRDLRLDCCEPDIDLAGWTPVRTAADVDFSRLCGPVAPPVRRIEEVSPVMVSRPHPDRQIVDLGQNINGWVKLSNLGPSGSTITLTHGEALDTDGDLTIEHIADGAVERGEPFQRDQVTSAGRSGDSFEPRHTTHGFRYVRVEGHPDTLSSDDVRGVVVHTDLRRTGWFECSDQRLNRLHDAIVWSFRGNACDIPTDCPTRERAGWTGDWQIFVPTAAFLYDVAGFSAKWLRDLAADQRPEGEVWYCAPNHEAAPFHPLGSAGWGDAAVIVPWEVYQAYGDRDLLAQQWDSMAAWVAYAQRKARQHPGPPRESARKLPSPQHEHYVWNSGFHFGEWLEPDMLTKSSGSGDIESHMATLHTADHSSLATAYLYRSTKLLATMARIVGRADDGSRYDEYAASVKAAWQAEFMMSDGLLKPDTQATYVRSLAFDLVPEAARAQVAERLVDLVRKADTHLDTGFLATADLLPVLADTGHVDVAYELLLQDTEPSWLAMINRGGTTVWEHWSGLDEEGRPNAPKGVGSLNHYSKGAVASFLHRYVAGIRPNHDCPGYRRFTIEPCPGGGLVSASAAHDSPYGRIESRWHLDGDRFTAEIVIPPGATADVVLPGAEPERLRSGSYRLSTRVRRHDR